MCEDELYQFDLSFDDIDTEKVGYLTRESVLKAIFQSESSVDRLVIPVLFNEFDINQDNMISRDEFDVFLTQIRKLTKKEIAKKAFQIADTENTGSLDSAQFLRLATLMGMECTNKEIQATIKSLDQNGNNTIELDEFLELIE